MSKTKVISSIILLIVVGFVAIKFIKYHSKEEIITQDTTTTNFLIVYQSKRLGVTTQNTCSFAPYGGIKREMNKVNLLRTAYNEILYLDAGNSLAPLKESDKKIKSAHEVKIESALSIAQKLVDAKIDALGVGETDMGLGISKLKEIEQKTSIPLVSSNIKYRKTNKYPFKRYILKTIKGIKFSIISLTDPEFVEDSSVEVLDPKKVIEELVPSLKKDSDFIILLSQMPVDTIANIISESPEASNIQIVIASDLRFSAEKTVWLNQGKTILANQFTQGYYLGELEINYKKPFVAFSSETELKNNLDKLDKLQKIVDNPNTPKKIKDATLKSIDRINTTLQVTPIPGATSYIGSVSGLDSIYDN